MCKNPCICVHLFENFRIFLRHHLLKYISGTCFLPHGHAITCMFVYILSVSLLLCDESYITNHANLLYFFHNSLRGTDSCLSFQCPKREYLLQLRSHYVLQFFNIIKTTINHDSLLSSLFRWEKT
jgi:hypothetical protein